MQFDIDDEVVGPFSTPESYLQRARKCTKRATYKALVIADREENGQVPVPLAYEGTIDAMLRRSQLPTSARVVILLDWGLFRAPGWIEA
jgi:hypothetical protein